MGRITALWYAASPAFRIAVIAAVAFGLVAVIYVYWPAPAASATERALKDEIKARDAVILKLTQQAAQLATASAASFDAGVAFGKESDEIKAQLPAVHAKRRAVVSSGKTRADELAATPDDQLRVAHDRQLERTRAALKRALQSGATDDPDNVPVHP